MKDEGAEHLQRQNKAGSPSTAHQGAPRHQDAVEEGGARSARAESHPVDCPASRRPAGGQQAASPNTGGEQSALGEAAAKSGGAFQHGVP